MAPIPNKSPERQFYIDWLRILLILSVYFYHIGMFFNSWDWHVKNQTTYDGALRSIMIFLHYWRMPLLFLVSGAGTWFALGKRSSLQYLKERSVRLVLPFLAGIFILVPVQVYTERSGQYASLIDFYPHMFEGVYPEGNFSWHHLWFILYLFFISLVITPFLKFFRGKKFRKFTTWFEGIASRPLGLNIVMLPIILSQVILRQYFETGTFAFYNDWASISFYILFFLAGLIMLPNKKISEAIQSQRSLYLIETILATALMFGAYSLFSSDEVSSIVWDVSSLFLAWSCGLTAIGFGRKYLNRDNRFRKLANEAIYPFYLLHQPVIVVLAPVVSTWQIGDLSKALIIAVAGFLLVMLIYILLIYRVNFLRVIFGMKPLKRPSTLSAPHVSLIIQKAEF